MTSSARVLPPVLPIRDRRFADRASMPLYLWLLAAVLFLQVAVALGPFDWDTAAFAGVLTALALMIGLGMAIRWLGSPAIAAPIEMSALLFCCTIAAPLCAVVMARSALPLADGWLARADALLFFGFDRRALMAHLAGQTAFFNVVEVVYHSLLVQPFLILLALCATGERERAWTLVLAWALALAICVAICPLVPAFGTPPYSFRFVETLEMARDGRLHVLDQSSLTGIITFPSFHAAGATVLGWAGSGIRKVGPLFVAWNVLLFASALFGGGHYLVDLVAGGLVGLAAIKAAEAVYRRMPA